MFESKPKKQEDFLQTPDVARKELLSNVDGQQEMEGEIHVMPEKFRQALIKKGIGGRSSGFSIWKFLLIILIVFLIGGGVFYWWVKTYYLAPLETFSSEEDIFEEQPEEKAEQEKSVETQPQEVVEEKQEQEVLSPPFNVKTMIKNQQGEILSYLEIDIPKGAYDPNLNPDFAVKEIPFEEKYNQGDYQVIVGPYQVLPTDIVFNNKPAKIISFYSQDIINPLWEDDLKLGYFKDGIWSDLNAVLDKENNLLTAEVNLFPSEVYAIICSKDVLTQGEEGATPVSDIETGDDADKDGLTDLEEYIYGTDINNKDTDNDGMSDSKEVINLRDPKQAESSKDLISSGTVKLYTNPVYNWSIFYPFSWLVREVPETQSREILIITETSEFFSITIQDNPNDLDLKQWYLAQSPGVKEEQLSLTKIKGKDALWSPDGLTLYLKDGKGKVFTISYNLGTLQKANFQTTFQMMINSFQYVEPSEQTEEEASEEDQDSQEETAPEATETEQDKYIFSQNDLTFVGFETGNFNQKVETLSLIPLGLDQVLSLYQTSLEGVLDIGVINNESASSLYDQVVLLYSLDYGEKIQENAYGDKSVKLSSKEGDKYLLVINKGNWIIAFNYSPSDEEKVAKLVQIALGKI